MSEGAPKVSKKEAEVAQLLAEAVAANNAVRRVADAGSFTLEEARALEKKAKAADFKLWLRRLLP